MGMGKLLYTVIASGRAKPHMLRDGVEYKYCSKCNTWRPLSRFSFSAGTLDKLQGWCKLCHSDLARSRKKKKQLAYMMKRVYRDTL